MLMTENDWNNIKYFSPHENWGDWTKIYKKLIYTLDKFREYLGKPIIINCGYSTTGHTSKSFHYKGMAVDIHIKNMHVVDQFLAAERFDEFNGIGLYPNWHNPGLHLDIRPKTAKKNYDARWLGIIKNGKMTYVSLSWKNIIKYCK